MGLAALLVGGVGVANAVKSHLDRRRDVVATFKAVGATGREVFTIYLTQVMILAAVGSLIGLVIGAALPFAIVGVFGNILPLPVDPTFHPGELALSFVYGLLTALAFGLWPLAQVHDVPVATLFRESVASEFHWPRRRYLAFMTGVIALLVAIAIGLAYDKRVATVFVASSIGVFHRSARHGVRADGFGATLAAPAPHHVAACDRKHPPPRRIDSVCGDIAWTWARGAGDRHPD